MTLRELAATALQVASDLPETPVQGIAQDSRRVEPGFVFVARRGAVTDGHDHVPDALKRGAVAVVGELAPHQTQGYPWSGKVPYLRVPDPQTAAAKLAAAYHRHPSRSLKTLGVTGTDGKTTTCFVLHHLLAGVYRTGLLSTASIRIGEEEVALQGHFTTPEAPEVQALLARFRDSGLTHAVIESSSHGFAQRRLDEVDFDIGIWTNLSAEHLDFHGSLPMYRHAKATLMRRAHVSVLNADEPDYEYFASCARSYLSYGVSEKATWRAERIRLGAASISFDLRVAGGPRYPVRLPMIGEYNVHNALAALVAACRAGIDLKAACLRLATFPGVPGRMQLVQVEPFAVVVDFAHTPGALERALKTLRLQTRRRLLVVIGAAGERDPGKREPLGRAAATHADFAVFTEEDSRSEDANDILAEMAKGAGAAGASMGVSYTTIAHRREAIRFAVALAQPGDLVLLAGKGHEATLERERETLEWNEVAEAEQALAARRDRNR